jgi:hypothetical protein
LQSQGEQDLCVVAASEHLIFKTSTEEKTVDLTNKVTTKDSQRFLLIWWLLAVFRVTMLVKRDVETVSASLVVFQ